MESDIVSSGTGALHLSTPGGGSYARVVGALAEPVLSGSFYVRFKMFIPSTVSIDDYLVVLEWLVGNGKVSFDLVGSFFQVHVSKGNIHTAGLVPRDRWFCVLLNSTVADQGSITLSIDNQVTASASGDTLPDQGIERVFLSALTSPSQQNRVDLHIDELVASRTPLSCP